MPSPATRLLSLPPFRSRSNSPTPTTSNKQKYSSVRPIRPPPLSNELALLQFMNGGKIDTHIKRVMDAQAQEAAGYSGHPLAVADVSRDTQGGIWWDQEEEWEYTHLLEGAKPEEDDSWVAFGDPENITDDLDEQRSPLDSYLDTSYIVRPSHDENLSGISLPAAAKHLTKNEHIIDLDAAFPRRAPLEFHLPIKNNLNNTPTPSPKRKGLARRRSAPSNLLSPTRIQRPTTTTDSLDLARIRKDFIDDSFMPHVPLATTSSRDSSVSELKAGKNVSKKSYMRALFKKKS